MISDNIKAVEERLEKATILRPQGCAKAQLIAVSKTKPVPMLQEAYDTGIRDFGENKVQELVDKIDQMPSDIRWHLIGHLQTNKVKYIVGKTYLIHSVDSVKLAKEIQKEAEKKNCDVDILIEVNVAGEESKFGLSPRDVLSVVRDISVLDRVHIKGLMTIAPYTDDAESNRGYFRQLRDLSVDIDSKNIDNVSMNVLSMGMTGDYEVAAEEGASFVRVGTGIFGERNYAI